MTNIGTTIIEARGNGKARELLNDFLDKRVLEDGLLSRHDARIEMKEEALLVSIHLPHDRDYLALAPILAERFPEIDFLAWYAGEGSFPEAHAARYHGKMKIYAVKFDEPVFAAPAAAGRPQPLVRLYPWSPEAELAARDHLHLEVFTAPPPHLARAAVWCVFHEACDQIFFLRSATEGLTNGLAIEVSSGTISWFSGVDQTGGYRHREALHLPEFAERAPELLDTVGPVLRAYEERMNVPECPIAEENMVLF